LPIYHTIVATTFTFVQLAFYSEVPLLLNGLHLKLEFRILVLFIGIIWEGNLLCGNGRDEAVSLEVTCERNFNTAQQFSSV